MSNYNREEQVKELHEKRKQKTKEKVEAAIKRLTRASKPINFNSVATEAGITKATLYNHKDLKERIDFLRNQQEKAHVDSKIQLNENNQNAIIASYKRTIEKLEKRIKELEKENKQLREEDKQKLSDYFKLV